MLDGQFVFTQLMEFLPRREFNACVTRYGGQRRERGFSCRDQFLCLAFAQLTFRESLRDIETCLRALEPKLYHAGFRGKISRSTLADANRAHDWRIYADLAQVLIRHARQLYAQEPLAVDLEQMDQTASADQSVLWHDRQRREDPSLDRDQRLRARGHREKGTADRTQLVRNVASPQPHPVRENPAVSRPHHAKTTNSRPHLP